MRTLVHLAPDSGDIDHSVYALGHSLEHNGHSSSHSGHNGHPHDNDTDNDNDVPSSGLGIELTHLPGLPIDEHFYHLDPDREPHGQDHPHHQHGHEHEDEDDLHSVAGLGFAGHGEEDALAGPTSGRAGADGIMDHDEQRLALVEAGAGADQEGGEEIMDAAHLHHDGQDEVHLDDQVTADADADADADAIDPALQAIVTSLTNAQQAQQAQLEQVRRAFLP